jgi:hypothetical protein
MHRKVAFIVLLFWMVIAVSPSFPGTMPDCCKDKKNGYCPMRKSAKLTQEAPVAKPSCHESTTSEDFTLRSVCTHQMTAIVFWFDAIVSNENNIENVPSAPLFAENQPNSVQETANVNTPPPKHFLS